MGNSNDIESKNGGIGIYFRGLTVKERTTFVRVIAYNLRRGLQLRICDNIDNAKLIILSEDVLSQIENITSKTVVVVGDHASGNVGDCQLGRPLVITRVMNALGDAVNLIEGKNPTPSVPAETQAETSQEGGGEKPKFGHRALVIDDSAAIRKQLQIELKEAGFTADFADSGEKGLEMVEGGHFDLIFLDIVMPGIDGYETCKRMRSMAAHKKTPIIMLSGRTKPLDEVRGIISGATTYLTKPVNSDMLQEALTRVRKWIDNFSTDERKKKSSTAA